MATILGVDAGGVVRLVGSGGDVSMMPKELNGAALTVFVLSATQEAAFSAMPPDRGGTTFDGVTFTAQPATQPAAPMTTEQKLVALGISVVDLKAALAK